MTTSVNANNYKNQKLRGLKRKYEYTISRGGKCEICGYNKNMSALEFHHLDPSTKEFCIDIRHFSNTILEKLENELSKCAMVCSNCHRELHNPTLSMENIPKIIEGCNKKSFGSKKETSICPVCSNSFYKVKGKIYCSKECNEASKGYPSYNEIVEQYEILKSWDKVANYFGITRKITQGICKRNS